MLPKARALAQEEKDSASGFLILGMLFHLVASQHLTDKHIPASRCSEGSTG